VGSQKTYPILVFSSSKSELEKTFEILGKDCAIYNSSSDYDLEKLERAKIILLHDKYISKLILVLNFHSQFP
jgi:hypothetical protein